MTARRAARGRAPVLTRLTANGELPACLQVGACIEVWGDPDAETLHHSAWRRFQTARRYVADLLELKPPEAAKLLSNRTPWSASFLVSVGRGDDAADRLARVGATMADLPELQAEACSLLAAAGE